MNFQKELQNSKQIVREWVRTNFSDEKTGQRRRPSTPTAK